MSITFTKVGKYWGYPLWKKVWLNTVYWFKGFYMFLRCIKHYEESVLGNDMTILGAWKLCFSIQEMRLGKSYKIDFIPENDK